MPVRVSYPSGGLPGAAPGRGSPLLLLPKAKSNAGSGPYHLDTKAGWASHFADKETEPREGGRVPRSPDKHRTPPNRPSAHVLCVALRGVSISLGTSPAAASDENDLRPPSPTRRDSHSLRLTRPGALSAPRWWEDAQDIKSTISEFPLWLGG